MWLSAAWLVVNPVVTAMISALMMKAHGTLIRSMQTHTHTHNRSVSLLTSLIPLWERGISRWDWTLACVCASVCRCCLSPYLPSNVQNRNLGKGSSSTELYLTFYSFFPDFFFLSFPLTPYPGPLFSVSVSQLLLNHFDWVNNICVTRTHTKASVTVPVCYSTLCKPEPQVCILVLSV